MPAEWQPRILIAALATLLIEALEQEETAHLATGQLVSELRGLLARTEGELEEHSGRRRLRIAEEPADRGESAVSDD